MHNRCRIRGSCTLQGPSRDVGQSQVGRSVRCQWTVSGSFSFVYRSHRALGVGVK